MLPLFVDVKDKQVLVVGGGAMAHAKVLVLLQAGAQVQVVSPACIPAMHELPITLHPRRFSPDDVLGKWFVVAAAPPDVNREVAAAAAGARVFVNAVDDPAHATAYLGGVVRRGDVTLAFSTGGRAPALAGLLREALDAVLPSDIAAWSVQAVEERKRWKRDELPMTARRPALLETLVRLYDARREGPAR